ncbi:MAG: tetratricopeptide repeat protein [Chitinophagales bacterium]
MRNFILITGLAVLLTCISFCTGKTKKNETDSPYLNQNDTVRYVGMETCRLCHSDKYESFRHTGMGMSFDHATRKKSAALFDEAHALVFDSMHNFYYKPYWKGDDLMVMEFRIEAGDTTHKRVEKIAYIVGSGQHTNSHMIDVNGYIYQAPITFYTQKQEWDMAPGMEDGFNARFSRVIEFECMNCHNGYPEPVIGSVNKYQLVKTGIDCERCHGPGGLHVERVSNNILVDTSNEIDYSIVNPKKLPIDLQNALCMRCHLQGVDVLNDGATYFDFKPGDKINDHWNIFLPRFDGKNDKFLMASQADRLMQSKCFIESGKISCITCHDPHVSVKETPVATFNNACIQCHSAPEVTCTEKIAVRQLQNDNCSGCHIQKSGSVDIPHVSISDHNIRIPGRDDEKPEGTFIGLKCMTDDAPSAYTMAKGYLHYYESFTHDPLLLDSVEKYLQHITLPEQKRTIQIHLYYVQQDFLAVTKSAASFKPNDADAYTAFRVGDAWMENGKYAEAIPWLQTAEKWLPYDLDFRFKLGSAYLLHGDIAEATKEFQFILTEDPKYEKAWNNLGFIQMNTGKTQDAEASLLQCLQLDPDYLQARINLAELYIANREKYKAKQVIDYLEKHNPDDPQVSAVMLRYRAI